MNIISQLRTTVIILLGFVTFNVLIIYSYINKMTDDATVVNYTGIVRGKSQRIVKLEIAQENAELFKNELAENINGLRQGSKKIGLPEVKDSEFQNNMAEVQEQWNLVEKQLNRFKNNPEIKNELINESEQLWDLTNKATFSAQDFAKGNVQQSKIITVIIFVVNIILLGFIWKITENIAYKLNESIRVISISSDEITSTFEQQERVVQDQASSTSQTSTTMEELEISSQQSSQEAEMAAKNAKKVGEISVEGNETVTKTLNKMSLLEQEVNDIATAISELSQQTLEISTISQLVSDIANQTNMLALNASVEAMRAGEHGKGFSVVAGEIRKLADQSKISANKIKDLIKDIQTAIKHTVSSSQETTKTVKDSVIIAEETAKAFDGVASAIEEIVLSSHKISLNAKQQTNAISEVLKNVTDLSKTGQDTTKSIKEIRQGTEQLNNMITNLKKMVSH